MSGATCTVLVDFGSTFTKLRAVAPEGTLVAGVQHRTTVESDVFEGLDLAMAELQRHLSGTEIAETLACSSAGGGLRMAVVGLVEDLTTEAARQAALGAGARVLAVKSGGLPGVDAARALLAQAPDIVMLVGGTDEGDAATLIGSARALAEADPQVPVVLAGNLAAQPEAAAILQDAGALVVRTANVLPAVDQVAPEPARRTIRELFISHVIGGKLGGSTRRLEEMVCMATPDAALEGVGVLAEVLGSRGEGGGVIVVDVGGATTDVHSFAPHTEHPGYKHSLLPQSPAARTVEADLGMRWNAPGILEAAREEGLITTAESEALAPGAKRRAEDPGFLPDSASERDIDRALARLAIAIALRRHAGRRRVLLTSQGAVLERQGRDLSEVRFLIAAGGVSATMRPRELLEILELARSGREQSLLPVEVRPGLDRRGTIFAAGLLAARRRAIALRLLEGEIDSYLSIPEEEADVLAVG